MIKLAPFEKEDFEKLISWIDNEEELVQFAGPVVFKYPLTKEQLVTYISDDKRFAFKVIDAKTNETIGHAEIYLVKPDMSRLCRVLIGRKEYRGKGIGQQIIQQLKDYSFDRFNVEIIELNVYDWNISAIKCYEKVGFKINPSSSNTTEINGNSWTAINMIIQKEKKTADNEQ
jgi:RimJ/RimL family protein N-acetyltransferase